MIEYIIRKVKKGDEAKLAHIQTESWKAAFKNILSENILMKAAEINKTTKMYKQILDENIGNGYILEINGKAQCIAWWDQSRDDDMKGYAELICIHSLPDTWRKGYGTIMMNFILSEITKAGYNQVMLWVFKDNVRARKFYESFGFTTFGKVKKLLEAEEVCYKKSITSNK